VAVAVGSTITGSGVEVGSGVAVITSGAAVGGKVAVGCRAASIVNLATTVCTDSVRTLEISGVGSSTTVGVGVLQPTRMSASARIVTNLVVFCILFMI
jgi:hypothetical protein